MKIIVEFFKKYWIIILILLAAILWVISKFLGANTKPQPSPTTNQKTASYKSIIPGLSSEADVKSQLGAPLTQKTESGNDILDYKSSNQYRNNTITIQNGKVLLIKEVVNYEDNRKSDSITSQYGTALYKLYSSNPNASFSLYVYPINGLAYLGHNDGTLLEIWYFQPTTIDNFINTWGQDYSLQPPTESNKY